MRKIEPMQKGEFVHRHSLATRIFHWVNALGVLLVLMSGLQIFNADPHLYWGQFGASPDKPLLSVGDRGFPHWLTLPSWQGLSTGRRWHFFFAWLLLANGLAYLATTLGSGHLRRDLLPTRKELAPSHLISDIRNHLRLRLPRGEAARHYNLLQKLAYLAVIFVLAPAIVLTGLSMSPGFDAACPWLVELLGGRQSARTLHFSAAMLLALFIFVHLFMVVVAGPWNEVRSMITGRYRLPPERSP
jgi:thiosulfate reductase cytochrome b subunit